MTSLTSLTSPRSWAATTALVAVASVALVGCVATVPMRPAPDATSPACAEITVRLPDSIDAYAKRSTDAQATAAWGNPAVILLTCGVAVPAPSTQRCVTIEGIDWLVDDATQGRGVFTTYGRDPAVQVVVDSAASSSNALMALSNAVGSNPATRACTNPGDAAPIPAPSP